jgi:hypothetical protein
MSLPRGALRSAPLVVLLSVGCGGQSLTGGAGASGRAGDDGAAGATVAVDAATDAPPASAEPRVVQPARAGACDGLDLALAGETLVWADRARGEVLRAPVAGGAPTALATGEDRPHGLQVVKELAYWMTTPLDVGPGPRPSREIHVAPLAGGWVTTLVAPQEGVGGFAVAPDGQTIYYGTSTTILSQPTAGGPTTIVANILSGGVPQGMAFEGTHLVYLDGVNGLVAVVELIPGHVAACVPWFDIGVGSPEEAQDVDCQPVADGNGALFLDVVSFRGGRVAWADGSFIKAARLSQKPTLDRTNPGALDAAVSGFSIWGDHAFTAVFDPNVPDEGELRDVVLGGNGAPGTPIARHQRAPRSVVADASRVAWSNGDCAIVSLAR